MEKEKIIKKWVLLLSLLTAFPPMSTDMYLPAIPSLVQKWQQPLSIINLTLVCFFLTYSGFLLIYGPLSDRFGRRRPLMVGIAVYVLSSLLCALSTNAGSLIAFRMLQGAGSASASALSMAVCKDVFDDRQREKVLAYIAVIMSLAPMLAPVIGGWILTVLSWQWIFIMLGIMGTIALFGVYLMPETLQALEKPIPLRPLSNYVRLLHNRRYIGLTLVMSLSFIPLFAFIASSSDIYITGFGLSERHFGYFFGFNALALMAGSFACVRLTRLVSSHSIITAGFAGVLVGGLWLLLSGRQGPWDLALPMFVISFSSGMSRPPSNNLVLQQVDRDAGTASSLLIFTTMMSGAAAMWFISLNWHEKIHVLGAMGVASGALVLSLWLLMRRFLLVRRLSSFESRLQSPDLSTIGDGTRNIS
ncbi:MAG: multidrug effflux MFS transporter [Desulfatiglandales bacterium]